MAVKPIGEIIREELRNVADAITQEQRSLGIRDSGRSAGSLVVQGSRARGATLSARAYLQTNFSGVGLQPKSSGGGLIEGLMEWGKLVPIPEPANPRTSTEESRRRQAAFKVGRALISKGSLIKRGAPGIKFRQIVNAFADSIADEVADNELERVVTALDKLTFVQDN